jgi:adenine phosphoribosyltransferase
MATTPHWISRLVRDIPDFPQPGVTFRDITPLLGDAEGFTKSITELVHRFADVPVDRVLGMEARGFIVAAPVAYRMGAGFIPVRKAGKLPWAVVREEYQLEYGSDKLEIHRDAIHPGERILVIDDVLATGGTAAATCRLVEALGGVVVARLCGDRALGGRTPEGSSGRAWPHAVARRCLPWRRHQSATAEERPAAHCVPPASRRRSDDQSRTDRQAGHRSTAQRR